MLFESGSYIGVAMSVNVRALFICHQANIQQDVNMVKAPSINNIACWKAKQKQDTEGTMG